MLLLGLIWVICRGCYNKCGRRWATRYYSKCEVTTITFLLIMCLGGFIAFALLLIPAAESARDGMQGTGDTLSVVLAAHLNILLNVNNLLSASSAGYSSVLALDDIYTALPYGSADPVDISNATSAIQDNATPIQTLGTGAAALRAAFSLLSYYPLDDASFDNNDSTTLGEGVHDDTRYRLPFLANETYTSGTTLSAQDTSLVTDVNGTAMGSADVYLTSELLRTPAAVGVHTFSADGTQTGFYNGSLASLGRAVYTLQERQITFTEFEQDIVVPMVAWGLQLADASTAAASAYTDYLASDGTPAAQKEAADTLVAAAETYLAALPTVATEAAALLEYHGTVNASAALMLDSLPRAKAALDAWASHITYATDGSSTNHTRDPVASPTVDGSVASEVAALDLSYTQDTDISVDVQNLGLGATAPYSETLSTLEQDLRMVEATWGSLPPLLHAMFTGSAFLRQREDWASLCPDTEFTDAQGNSHHILDRDVGLAMEAAHTLFYESGGVHSGYTAALDSLENTVSPQLSACRDTSEADTTLQALTLLAEIAPTSSPWVCEDTLPDALDLAAPLLTAAITVAAADTVSVSSVGPVVAAVAPSVTALATMVSDLHALLQPLLTQLSSPSYQDIHTFASLGSSALVAGTAAAAPLTISTTVSSYLALLTTIPATIASIHDNLTPCALPAFSSLFPPADYALADADRDDSPITAANSYDYAGMPYADALAVEPTDVAGAPASALLQRQLAALEEIQSARATLLAPLTAARDDWATEVTSLTSTRNSVYDAYEAHAAQEDHMERQLDSWGKHILVSTWILTVAPAVLLFLALLTRCFSSYYRWVMLGAVLCFLLLLFAGVYIAFIMPYAISLADHCPGDTLVKALQPTIHTSASSDFFDLTDYDLADMAGYFTTCQDAASTPIGLADTLSSRICDKTVCAPTLAGLVQVEGMQPHGLFNYTTDLADATPANVTAGTYSFAASTTTVSVGLSTLLQAHDVARAELAHALHTFRCENTIPLYTQLHSSLCSSGAPEAYLAVLALGLAALLLFTTVMLVCAYKRFHTPWRRHLNVAPSNESERHETAGLHPETDANPFVVPHTDNHSTKPTPRPTPRPTPQMAVATHAQPPPEAFALPPTQRNSFMGAPPPPPPPPPQAGVQRVPTRSLYVAQVEPHPLAIPPPQHSAFGTSHRTDSTPTPPSYPISPKYHTKIDFNNVDEPPKYESSHVEHLSEDKFRVASYANAPEPVPIQIPKFSSNNIEMSFAQARPRANTEIFTDTFDNAVKSAFNDR